LCVGDVVVVQSERRREVSVRECGAYESTMQWKWKVLRLSCNSNSTIDNVLVATVHRDSCTVVEDVSAIPVKCFSPPSQICPSFAGNLHSLLLRWFESHSKVSHHVTPAVLLHSNGAGYGKRSRVYAAASSIGVPVVHYSAFEILSEISANTQTSLGAVLENARQQSPCILLITHVEAFSDSAPHASSQRAAAQAESAFVSMVTQLRECVVELAHRVVLVCTTDALDRVGGTVMSCFVRVLEVCAPNDEERLQLLKRGFGQHAFVDRNKLSLQTRGLSARDVCVAIGNACRRACLERLPQTRYTQISLTAEDAQHGLQSVQSHNMANTIGVPDIPNVQWEDIGGMDEIRTEILDTIT
jgi:AAA+ superfamily predicted ATPase